MHPHRAVIHVRGNPTGASETDYSNRLIVASYMYEGYARVAYTTRDQHCDAQLVNERILVMASAELQTFIEQNNASPVLSFYLNGTKVDLHRPNPRWTLLDFIRSQHGLKGTKLGCGEGGCGACTVVLQTRDPRDIRRIRHLAINACLYPLVGGRLSSLNNVIKLTRQSPESMSSPSRHWGQWKSPIPCRSDSANCTDHSKYPIPPGPRHSEGNPGRCGFCTPGIVMSLYAMIRNAYDPVTGEFSLSEEEIEMKGHLDGNLCRCTGYKPILQAAKSFVQEDLQGRLKVVPGNSPSASSLDDYAVSPPSSQSCGRPGGCCRDSPSSACSSSSQDEKGSSQTSVSTVDSPADKKDLVPQIDFIPYVPTTELIYPPGLSKYQSKLIAYGDDDKVWLRPTTLDQALAILAQQPSATLVGGASEVQVDTRFKGLNFAVSVFVGDLPELTGITVPEARSSMTELIVGGNASLTDLEETCIQLGPELGQRGSVLTAAAKTLQYFAGRQIRNAASLAGNIATASPISDMNPLLLAVNAQVVAKSASEQTTLPMSSMFLGYRKTALPPGSLITQIRIPLPPAGVREITKSYKQAKRKDDDIAIVTASFRVRLDGDDHVSEVALAYGGMAPMTVLARSAGEYLQGKKWRDQAVLDGTLSALIDDFNLPYSVPGGMATYRRTLALSLFFRFWNEASLELGLVAKAACDADITEEIHRKISRGTRDEHNPHEQRVVGKQLPHLSGLKHATGEAEYIDDMAPVSGELFGAMVLSQRAHAKLVSVDWTPAIQSGLAVGYIDRHSIPAERNVWGSVVHDEPFFAGDEVISHGQPIGLVYADTALKAQEAAKAVKVVYEDLPAILTIDEAIEAKSFFNHGKELRKGAAPEGMNDVFAKCDRVFSGVTRIGGQEHFYLETNAALVVPHAEDGTMDVWSSTQNTYVSCSILFSLLLGLSFHQISSTILTV